MNKIGIIGEDPSDTSSIKNLLLQKFPKNVSFVPLINNLRGNQLDNPRTKAALEIEYKNLKSTAKPKVLLFIRDVDGLSTHKGKIQKCIEWYGNLSENIKCDTILLLNIWELEALIFADIEIFNEIYHTSIKGGRDVTFISDPKGELKKKTKKLPKKYVESDCPELFKKIRINYVIKNCKYFNDFFAEFSTFLKK